MGDCFRFTFWSPYIIEQFIYKLGFLGSLTDNLKITFKILPMSYSLQARMMKQRVEKHSRIAYYRVVTLSGPNRWSFLDGFLIALNMAYSRSRQHKLSLRA